MFSCTRYNPIPALGNAEDSWSVEHLPLNLNVFIDGNRFFSPHKIRTKVASILTMFYFIFDKVSLK